MAEEHNVHPWEGQGDDSSWQPSHIDKDAGSDKDSTDSQNDTSAETQQISGSQETQATTPIPTVHGNGGAEDHDEASQQTQIIPPADNQDTFSFGDLNTDTQQYGSFVEPRSSGEELSQPAQQEQTADDSANTDTAAYGQTSSDSGTGSDQYAEHTGDAYPQTPMGVQEGQPSVPLYRPAPQYGAYAPEGGDGQQGAGQNPVDAAQNGQSAAPQYGAYDPQQNQTQGDDANRPQYDPQQQGQYNPFAGGYGNEHSNQQGFGGSQLPPQGPGTPGQGGAQQGGQGQGKGKSKSLNMILVAVIAAVLSAALMLGLGWAAISNGLISTPTTSSLSSINSNSSGSGSATAKSGEAADWESVSKSVSNSVVAIDTVVSGGTAKGSGAILDTSGDVVTNNHVVEGATKIQVTLSSGQIYSAKVVGTDTTTDLAVIKIENPPSDLKPVTFADSDSLAVGESVMAIGNPLGYDNTATTGIVSALNRPVSVMDDTNTTIVTNAVQIDAAINPGNSGGPTFNAAGQVIGINSSIASTATTSSSAGSIGIGFAIPSNLVKRVSNEIIKNGSVQHVVLGITIQSATAEADGVTRAGAQVTKVTSGSAAANGGVKAGDTIVAFNGNAVNSNYALLGYVRASALGDKVTLTVVRNGKTLDLSVTLDQKEAAVSGSSKSDSDDSGNSDGSGSSGGSDDGGLTDPYGLFGN